MALLFSSEPCILQGTYIFLTNLTLTTKYRHLLISKVMVTRYSKSDFQKVLAAFPPSTFTSRVLGPAIHASKHWMGIKFVLAA